MTNLSNKKVKVETIKNVLLADIKNFNKNTRPVIVNRNTMFVLAR